MSEQKKKGMEHARADEREGERRQSSRRRGSSAAQQKDGMKCVRAEAREDEARIPAEKIRGGKRVDAR